MPRGKGRMTNRKKQFSKSHNRVANTKKGVKRKRQFSLHANHKSQSQKEEKRVDRKPEQKIEHYSSESEQDDDNPLNQLLSTLKSNLTNSVNAIDSEESDSSTSSVNDEETKIDESKPEVSEDDNNILEDTYDSDENECEIDPESLKEENDVLDTTDPFIKHLCYDLDENLIDCLQNTHAVKKCEIEWPVVKKLLVTIPHCEEISKETSEFSIEEKKTFAPLGTVPIKVDPNCDNPTELHIKSQIKQNLKSANKCLTSDTTLFTPLQSELFSIINNYQDLMFSERTFDNGEELRYVYSLHAINHVLKTRTKILHHNAKLVKKNDVPEDFRDQGLVRPKVLIVVPFRDSCLKVVQMLINILVPGEKGQVINKIRFTNDFSGAELILPKRNPKPEDYEKTFTGNCDDTFKIGIQVTKKSLKLYADFYSSDIIITSPLGLRMTVGADGENERDYDFLSSIELLILDQTELFLMQNWDHLIHVLNHMHMQPKDSHGTDFSRIRTWTLNGWSKYYRQTLIFSSVMLPEINSVFNKKCFNYAGCARTVNPIENGSILNVHVLVPQIYRKFEASSATQSIDARFEFFINKILPQYKDTIMKQCLIYIPSYFDYVKIRNYFKREDINFVQICEYSKEAKIARARDMFFHGDAHFVLYSERFHHFRRIRVKGIRHIIFYQPPILPHFYSEMCNLMHESYQNKKTGSMSNMTVVVLYSKYDCQQLASIVGTDRLTKMATSTKNFHMFTNTDS